MPEKSVIFAMASVEKLKSEYGEDAEEVTQNVGQESE